MKLRTTILMLPLIISCSMAFADSTTTVMTTTTATTQSTMTMPLSSILQQLRAKGFVCVKKIKMVNGVYEATAINKSGEAFKLHIDPQTGAILDKNTVRSLNKKMMMNMPNISMVQAAANIEKAGYTQIKEIKCACHHDYYKAEAMNASGETVDLTVNKTTGVVSQS